MFNANNASAAGEPKPSHIIKQRKRRHLLGTELIEEAKKKLEEPEFIGCIFRDALCASFSSSWQEPIVLMEEPALCGFHDDSKTSRNSSECG